MRLCVIGLGYIGLPTAAMFANHGFDVLGVDVNTKVVEALNQGEIMIEEPGLQGFVRSAVDKGKLRASTKPEATDAFIIAVPTPINKEFKADLSYVESASAAILPYLSAGNIIIVESTIPPRTITDVVCPILERSGLRLGEDLYIAHCPERVLPGQILIELVHNNRIIGGINEISAQKSGELYKHFVKGEIYYTDSTSAEMAKLMENTYRDVNIALANELALISERLSINSLEVIKMANKHPRVNIHLPGPGVGGHCLAVDPYFIVEKAPEEAQLIALSRKINNHMPHFVVDQVNKICQMPPEKVAVFGITYKGNIDDVRESPAVEIIHLLREQSIEVSIYDPYVKEFELPLKLSIEDAVSGVDCVLILTDHTEFKSIDFTKYRALMRQKNVFDTKNCLLHRGDGINFVTLGNYHKSW
ncbi:nucleotide sugar dehydrogenase [Paenibacillus alginolyticus]|uniref:Nucleotide sugar dehydrogenase n=1 Tax=Paenibacillus alginolyticus TaxID=59839 RepID=A0ABT4G8Q1_9BACL|nr:nucleotide sugar dehydrogenase [Paenibacillus alginolyticus]MCY9692566.1 nucleotide sugar dehydrogenase [Paenibacillus alginolyticus]MEC0143772.1 nucleotide sugar dehydrogenase [Paenibacillus alginolyticus]